MFDNASAKHYDLILQNRFFNSISKNKSKHILGNKHPHIRRLKLFY